MTDDTNTDDTVSKAEYEKAITRAQRFEGKLATYERELERFKGINPDEVSALRTELDSLKNQQAAGTGDPAKIEDRIRAARDELRQSLAGEFDTLKTTLQQRESQLKELQVDSNVFTQAAGEFVQGYHPELKQIIRKHCDLGEEGKIIIKDDKGEIRYSPNNKAKPMSVDEFIAELREQKDFAAVDKSASGGRTQGEKRSSGGAKITTMAQLSLLSESAQRQVLSEMTEQERADLARTYKV